MNTGPIKYHLFSVLLILLSVWLNACNSHHKHHKQSTKLFTLLDTSRTHVDFINHVQDKPDFNIINYPYFYDGGGVAVGDVNGDGLPDLYFTSNLHRNHLYLNEGHFKFKDITKLADVGGGDSGWTTGATMADVNGDGLMDIYVCRVNYRDKKGHNLLFINQGLDKNGIPHFKEEANKYGLAYKGYGTQAAFFDYDKDGDLDMYLLNHSVHSNRSLIRRSVQRKITDPKAGDQLFRNDGNHHFTNVTKQAGIYRGATGFGLGAAIHDINQDGWPDIYISNDFEEDDYLYINNGDGTFTNQAQELMGHPSQASMGDDIADFNNDGLPDILTIDMRPKNEVRYQRSGGPDSYWLAQLKKAYGYHTQVPRNTLQLNRGKVENGNPLFSDIGALVGVDATDWSWAGLFFDMNLDGRKDIFITNGIYHRPNNLDYLLYVSQPKIQSLLYKEYGKESVKLIKKMPSDKVFNHAFENRGHLSFKNKAKSWGLGQPSFSNGAAYVDLNDDGAPDLVVNNVNMPAFIYRNNTIKLTHNHYLKVKLQESGKNTQGIGAKVILRNNGKIGVREQEPVRGFESSVSYVLDFGLGHLTQIDSVEVIWPNNMEQIIQNVHTDQQITLKQSDSTLKYSYPKAANHHPVFKDVTKQFNINYKHQEDKFDEFKRQPLMPHMLSTEGPALAVGDVNGDGLDDIFAGGAAGQAGKLFVQTENGQFREIDQPAFRQDSASEDVDAVFFDANGDGKLDLYVVSGGDEFPPDDPRYQDRLYINDGHGNFTKSTKKLPEFTANGSCVIPGDFNGDGKTDLFVGSRSVPLNYGKTPRSYLLENEGNGKFKDVTQKIAPGLAKIGMVTDAKWADVNGDGKPDLIVVGEYMPVSIFLNENGRLANDTKNSGLQNTNGWWNTVIAGDFDGDGDIDLVAGNLGTNSVIKASPDHPLKLYLADFDGNGTLDPIITIVKKGKRYPLARLNTLMQQMPGIKKKFSSYGDFASRTIDEIFGKKELKNARVKVVKTFKNSYFENDGNGRFSVHPLPKKAQFTPVYAMLSGDFNQDGNKDILLAGNFYADKASEGRYDAGYGLMLAGTGKDHFQPVSLGKSGFIMRGQARSMKIIKDANGSTLVIVARNNNPLQLFYATKTRKH
jgi:hypothetical protein